MLPPALTMMVLVAAALFVMARGLLAPELALSGVVIVALLLGIVDTPTALAGFSSESVHTVGLLLIVSAAVQRSGAMGLLRRVLFSRASSMLMAQVRVILPSSVLSAFLNNTAVVALLLPVVREWGQQLRFSPSRLLIPLSYASILGGMCTLIGTSTNLVVQGLLPPEQAARFGMFDIASVGVPAGLAGLLVIFVVGRRLLPDRSTSDELFADPRTFATELVVEANGRLDGRRLDALGVDEGLVLNPVEIWRRGVVIAAPRRDEKLQADDHLVFAGPATAALAVHRIAGLIPADDQHYGTGEQTGRRFFELIIGARCPLVGSRVGEGSFRKRYGGAVVAVARHGEPVGSGGVRSWIFQVGDIVLVEGPQRLEQSLERSGELVVLAGHGDNGRHNPTLARLALLVVVAMVTSAATGLISTFMAVLLAATACIALRLLRWTQALEAIDARLLLTIAAALGVGRALEHSGAAAALAETLVDLGQGSPWATLAIVYVTTTIITELVTNNAAAVIMVPFALASAATLGVDPMAMIMAVAIAASASFVTPIGYQTNLMVYGPGGYRFADFLRAGLPVTLVVGATTIALAPLLWPF
ncbi:MAG: TRAP transporter large permease subunit [Myxococcales bacterium FL481]|nr:MAG: TRAP transporter large permease subunit [Myxococcales bacterium FL481]